MLITLNQLKIYYKNYNENEDNSLSLTKSASKLLRLNKSDFCFVRILKQSVDARKKPDIYYIFSVLLDVFDNSKAKQLIKKYADVTAYEPVNYSFPAVDTAKLTEDNRPVIVGMGPAGFMAGLLLAKAGLRPVIIEMGEQVNDRKISVERFWSGGELNTHSNIQFGEGGAGTFSDGKLQTGVKDKYGRIAKILEIFVSHGAPEDILYSAKPHIGSDCLPDMVANIRNDIISHGGEILFNTEFIEPVLNKDTVNPKVTGALIRLSDKNTKIITTDKILLCAGHSSRDLFKRLYEIGVNMQNKPFAVGMRVQHPQNMINMSRYGFKNIGALPVADYKLTYKSPAGRGIYSFCMCPGGYVVNASSENNRCCVNGMSNHLRDGDNANSAIVMTIDSSDYGEGVFDGMYFQMQLEEKAYLAGDGFVPVQTFGDFKNKKPTEEGSGIKPQICGKIKYTDLSNLLPGNMYEDFVAAIEYFGTIIPGFNNDDILLCGIESRTSSPVKILRDENFESNIRGLYPLGEGAGYAGGITSAAIDGLKVAEHIALLYNK